MVAETFEDFEPPSKKFLATSLKRDIQPRNDLKLKTEKKREREFFMSTVDENAIWIHKVIIMKCKTDVCFDKCNRKKIQHENL